jgi:hypothetical protein
VEITDEVELVGGGFNFIEKPDFQEVHQYVLGEVFWVNVLPAFAKRKRHGQQHFVALEIERRFPVRCDEVVFVHRLHLAKDKAKTRRGVPSYTQKIKNFPGL